MKRLCALLAIIVASIVVVGCGGSGGGSSSSPSSAPASTQAAPVATTTSAAGGATSGASTNSNIPDAAALGGATLAQAVHLCKQAVSREQGVSNSLKAKLNNICNQAGSGNKIAVKQAAHDVCVEIVKSKVPAAQQQAAEASCPAP